MLLPQHPPTSLLRCLYALPSLLLLWKNSVFLSKANNPLPMDRIPFLLASSRTLLRQFLPSLLDHSISTQTDAEIFPTLGGEKITKPQSHILLQQPFHLSVPAIPFYRKLLKGFLHYLQFLSYSCICEPIPIRLSPPPLY